MYLTCHTRFFPNFDSSSARSPHRGRIWQPLHVCAVVGLGVAPPICQIFCYYYYLWYYTPLLFFFCFYAFKVSVLHAGSWSWKFPWWVLSPVMWGLTLNRLGRRGMWPDVWISARSLAPWLWWARDFSNISKSHVKLGNVNLKCLSFVNWNLITRLTCESGQGVRMGFIGHCLSGSCLGPLGRFR